MSNIEKISITFYPTIGRVLDETEKHGWVGEGSDMCDDDRHTTKMTPPLSPEPLPHIVPQSPQNRIVK